MIGQCNHIIGFLLCDFPQYGETDRLIRATEGSGATEPFNYCPLCGEMLVTGTTNPDKALYAQAMDN